MKGLVRNSYSRNLWAIMDKFKVLPSDPAWQALTQEQVEWILYNMERDAEEQVRRAKGMKLDSEFQDFDESWYDTPHDEFTPIRDGHDEGDIARKLNDITTEDDMARLKARWEASQEVDAIRAEGGTTIEEDTINELISNNVQKAIDEARRIEKHGGNKWQDKHPIELEEERKNLEFKNQLNKEDIQDAVSLFNQGVEPTSLDDDFEI